MRESEGREDDALRAHVLVVLVDKVYGVLLSECDVGTRERFKTRVMKRGTYECW
jgi:hypothetical protein